jgi:hypothetical protein
LLAHPCRSILLLSLFAFIVAATTSVRIGCSFEAARAHGS